MSLFKYHQGSHVREAVGTAEDAVSGVGRGYLKGGNAARREMTANIRRIEGSSYCVGKYGGTREDRARQKWALVKLKGGGKGLSPEAEAGIRRDWAKEFKRF